MFYHREYFRLFSKVHLRTIHTSETGPGLVPSRALRPDTGPVTARYFFGAPDPRRNSRAAARPGIVSAAFRSGRARPPPWILCGLDITIYFFTQFSIFCYRFKLRKICLLVLKTDMESYSCILISKEELSTNVYNAMTIIYLVTAS